MSQPHTCIIAFTSTDIHIIRMSIIKHHLNVYCFIRPQQLTQNAAAVLPHSAVVSRISSEVKTRFWLVSWQRYWALIGWRLRYPPSGNWELGYCVYGKTFSRPGVTDGDWLSSTSNILVLISDNYCQTFLHLH